MSASPDRKGAAPVRLWATLWGRLEPVDRKRLKIAASAVLLSSVLTAVTPVLVGSFVDAVIAKNNTVTLSAGVTPLVLLIVALTLISLLNVARHLYVHVVTTSFQDAARQSIYGAVVRWDLKHFVKTARGTFQGRAARSVEGSEKLIKLGVSDLLPALTVALFAMAVAVISYGWIGVVMWMVIPTSLLIVAIQISSQDGIRRQVNASKEQLDGDVSANVASLDVIRTTGTEDYFDTRVRQRSISLRNIEMRHHKAMGWFDFAKAVNKTIWLGVTIVAAVTLRHHFTPGDFAGVVLLYMQITRPLEDVHRVIDEGFESGLQAQNLLEDLAIPHDISYGNPKAGLSAVGDPAVALSLRDITLVHNEDDPKRKKVVLRGVTTQVNHGQRIGIVGTTGCGKSTLLKIIARLLHGAGGELQLYGRQLEDVPREELVAMLGYVAQTPQLFAGSVRDNLLLGREDVTDEELARACFRANIHQRIMEMPEGYDSVIGQEGSTLSGGERQRLCLARALVKTPKMMLLDEPTSALDSASQTVVQNAIDELDDITMLIVAHRLHTLRSMDRILVLDKGRIVEQGTYAELAGRGGMFAAMLASERGSVEEPDATAHEAASAS